MYVAVCVAESEKHSGITVPLPSPGFDHLDVLRPVLQCVLQCVLQYVLQGVLQCHGVQHTCGGQQCLYECVAASHSIAVCVLQCVLKCM